MVVFYVYHLKSHFRFTHFHFRWESRGVQNGDLFCIRLQPVYVDENDLKVKLWQKMTTYRTQREALSGSTGFGSNRSVMH